ncbi:alpha/beta fold hydrolase [Nocardia fluminea]|uniref:alpha/beta fold hydrolase n=1 Tax=Nocardia fluminea TaxID=134984 RepID=UPI00366D8188
MEYERIRTHRRGRAGRTVSADVLFTQDVGAGPAVVMLAGFGLDRRIWDGQVEALARTHRVVCVDLLGTGGSPKPLDGYSTTEQADLVLAALDHLGVGEFALVGHSFGGMVAFAVAAIVPSRVRKLILVGSNGVRAGRSASFPFGAPGEKLLPLLVDTERRDRAAGRRRTLAAGFAEEPDRATLDHLVAISMTMPSWSAIPTLENMYRTDQLAMIPLLPMPVCFLVGELDRVHPSTGALWLQTQLRSATVEIVPAAGHYLMLENPDAFNALLRRELTTPSER